jgi:hypothetical protein
MSKMRALGAGILLAVLLQSGCAGKNPDGGENSSPFASMRYARARDVELDLVSVKPGVDGFPVVNAVVRNLTNDQIVLEYGPGSLMVHCGKYFQRGPGATSAIRQEILQGYGYVEFAPVTGGWREKSGDGNIEMLVLERLPSGDYDVWGSFFSSKMQGGRLDSAHQTYRNPAGTPSQ